MMLTVQRLLPFVFAAILSGAPVRFARSGEMEGVAEIQLRAGDPWRAAIRNTPVPQSARLRTETGRLETELDDGSVLRITGSSLAELSDYTALSTGQRITLIALDHGVAYFTGRPQNGDTLALSAPGAQISLARRARVRLEVTTGATEIAVLEGKVRFSTPSAELDLREGQLVRVQEGQSGHFKLLREIPELADDDWSKKRDVAQETSPSLAHLPGFRSGALDLDLAGSWLQTDDAGLVWKPKVTEGWIPFRTGAWRWYDEIGYTWIAGEEWGWAPYHVGRWLQHAALGWVWVPGSSHGFKPGDVYWMRSPGLALWGALAPNELWTGQGPPTQFAALNTTLARYEPGQRELDPKAEESAKPKDLLSTAHFTVALPSPPLAGARLDAINSPFLSAPVTFPAFGSQELRVPGASFEPRNETTPPATLAPSPPPRTTTVLVDRPVYVEVAEPVEIYYPFPVYSGVVVLNPVVTTGRDNKHPAVPDTSAQTNQHPVHKIAPPESTHPVPQPNLNKSTLQ